MLLNDNDRVLFLLLILYLQKSWGVKANRQCRPLDKMVKTTIWKIMKTCLFRTRSHSGACQPWFYPSLRQCSCRSSSWCPSCWPCRIMETSFGMVELTASSCVSLNRGLTCWRPASGWSCSLLWSVPPSIPCSAGAVCPWRPPAFATLWSPSPWSSGSQSRFAWQFESDQE